MVDDPYLKSLEDLGNDIARREDSLAKQEEVISAQRTQLNADRVTWKAAIAHYQEFLKSQGKQVPLFTTNDANDKQVTSDFTKVNLRVGPQRRAVLFFIAKLSKAGHKVTTREIMEDTGLDGSRVSNVVWSDCNRGILDRVGDQVGMTRKGFEFVDQAGVYSTGKN